MKSTFKTWPCIQLSSLLQLYFARERLPEISGDMGSKSPCHLEEWPKDGLEVESTDSFRKAACLSLEISPRWALGGAIEPRSRKQAEGVCASLGNEANFGKSELPAGGFTVSAMLQGGFICWTWWVVRLGKSFQVTQAPMNSNWLYVFIEKYFKSTQWLKNYH